MNPLYFFIIWSSLTNQQVAHTQICTWLKATVAPPWTQLVMQPSNSAIATQLRCTSANRNKVMDFIDAAIAYSDANWHPVNNPDAITDVAALFPNPLDPACLAFLTS